MESDLPIYLTSFVGRERDVAEVARLLSDRLEVRGPGPAGTSPTVSHALVALRPVADLGVLLGVVVVDHPGFVIGPPSQGRQGPWLFLSDLRRRSRAVIPRAVRP